MRWFLDMCFIVYYASETNNPLEDKVRILVKNKKENYLVCLYILNKNLPDWIKRNKEVIFEAKKIIESEERNPNLDQGNSILSKKQNAQLKKLLNQYSISNNKEDFFINIKKRLIYLEGKINFFIEKYVDEKVIPIEQINQELRSSLLTYLDNNISDANTIASGVQENKNKEVILVTADKQHWTKDNLEWALPEHSPLRKEYPNLPQIKYIQDS